MEESEEARVITMGVHEIRDVLQFGDQDLITNLEILGARVYTKRINLKRGYRHTMNHFDFFIDLAAFINVADSPQAKAEIFVSTRPVDVTTISAAPGDFNITPAAAEDYVLYKARLSVGTTDAQTVVAEFPNNFLAGNPTFSWYTPYVYISYVVYEQQDLPDAFGRSFTEMSFYMALDDKKVSGLEYSMGLMQEKYQYIVDVALASGWRIASKPDETTGQTYPALKFGGMKPERMLRGDALADFWLSYNTNQSEKTMDPTNIRTFIRQSSTMQPYDVAYGTVDVAKGDIPDWINLSANASLMSAVRPQWPPMKKLDNGNTEMF